MKITFAVFLQVRSWYSNKSKFHLWVVSMFCLNLSSSLFT